MRRAADRRDPGRLDRIPNRHLASQKRGMIINAIQAAVFLEHKASGTGDFKSVKICLLKETEERIAILSDPNFDCLATNTTAGCSFAAIPRWRLQTELNSHVLGLITKLNGGRSQGRSPNTPGGAGTRSTLQSGG